MDNLFAWSEDNRQHLSVGAVILNDKQEVLVHKLERIGNKFFLPKKTHSNNLTLEQTLDRVENEVGYRIKPIKYLGSRQSTFPSENGIPVEKTTLYFLCQIIQQTQRDPNDRDNDSELLWVEKTKLISTMQEQGRDANDLDESIILLKT